MNTTVADCVASRVGQVSHTLVTSKNVPNSTDRPVVKEAEGYVYCRTFSDIGECIQNFWILHCVITADS